MRPSNVIMKHSSNNKIETESDPQASAAAQPSAEEHHRTYTTAAEMAQKSLSYWGIDLSAQRLLKPLSERYRIREAYQQQRYQDNLERILRHGMKMCEHHTADVPLDLDWLHCYIDLAQTISQPAMQGLWSRIFAQESMYPGSFSFKALTTLKGHTQREAKLFQRTCELASRTPTDGGLKLIFGYHRYPGWRDVFGKRHSRSLKLGNFGLPYSALLIMTDSHLLHRGEMTSAELQTHPAYPLQQGQHTVLLTPRHIHSRLRYYRFTPLGEELAQLLPRNMDESFRDTLNQCLEETFSINEGGTELSGE